MGNSKQRIPYNCDTVGEQTSSIKRKKKLAHTCSNIKHKYAKPKKDIGTDPPLQTPFKTGGSCKAEMGKELPGCREWGSEELRLRAREFPCGPMRQQTVMLPYSKRGPGH